MEDYTSVPFKPAKKVRVTYKFGEDMNQRDKCLITVVAALTGTTLLAIAMLVAQPSAWSDFAGVAGLVLLGWSILYGVRLVSGLPWYMVAVDVWLVLMGLSLIAGVVLPFQGIVLGGLAIAAGFLGMVGK